MLKFFGEYDWLQAIIVWNIYLIERKKLKNGNRVIETKSKHHIDELSSVAHCRKSTEICSYEWSEKWRIIQIRKHLLIAGVTKRRDWASQGFQNKSPNFLKVRNSSANQEPKEACGKECEIFRNYRREAILHLKNQLARLCLKIFSWDFLPKLQCCSFEKLLKKWKFRNMLCLLHMRFYFIETYTNHGHPELQWGLLLTQKNTCLTKQSLEELVQSS